MSSPHKLTNHQRHKRLTEHSETCQGKKFHDHIWSFVYISEMQYGYPFNFCIIRIRRHIYRKLLVYFQNTHCIDNE
jgi:hypothetical protein